MDTFNDQIPLEEAYSVLGPNDAGMMSATFYAFNTVVTLQAFGPEQLCRSGFDAALKRSRYFERRFSRTLPHSGISHLNLARGSEVCLAPETYEVLKAAQHYCEQSQGLFDITMGAAVRLWNFFEQKIPTQADLKQALDHVDWKTLQLRFEGNSFFGRLADRDAAVDVGGVAKGYIADKLTETMSEKGLKSFIVNLGGNVVAHGKKPDGSLWRIGLQDPQNKQKILQAIEIENASAVTSGIYERCFIKNGQLYHHILSPKTGMPVNTDVAGVSVVASRSLDCDGFSTTLLALGIKSGLAFAASHPEILQAYFIDRDNNISTLY